MKFKPSPNFGERKNGAKPSLIILHYTDTQDMEEALTYLMVPEKEASAHYVVDYDGSILQLVDEDKRAWHAGVSQWNGITDVNSHSIGIEIVNPGHTYGLQPYPQVQIDAVKQLCRDIMARWEIKPEGVLGHSDVAPGRKIDPGKFFPWAEFEAEGLAKRPPKKDQ